MSNSGESLDPRGLRRGMVLGLGVFAAYVVAAGVLWALGTALGLGNVAAFFLAACAGPLLVTGALLLWVLSLPQARRQRLVGLVSTPPPDDADAGQGPTQ